MARSCQAIYSRDSANDAASGRALLCEKHGDDAVRMGLLVVLAALAAAPARAELPNYDVKSLCLHQASLWGSVDQTVLKDCYRQQQTAYDSLKRIWPTVP